jgi:hypothetical protein
LKIEDFAFSGCSGLVLPDGLKSILDEAVFPSQLGEDREVRNGTDESGSLGA